jgi:hypothetical protein
MSDSGVVFKVTLDSIPETGKELCQLIDQARKSVTYNIGPEPIRFTKGPIYADSDPDKDRIGTWSIEHET